MNQLLMKRRVERGWEYVSFLADEGRQRVLEYQASDGSPDKQYYKEYLCYLCGYPESEWIRVADVQVKPSMKGLIFEVKFANPGKWFEHHKAGTVLSASADEEAWALIKTMHAKLNSGAVSTVESK